MTLTDRAMSNETETMKSDPPTPANQDTPQTPEQLMQAATARIAELEAEVAELKDRWMRSEAEVANVRARAHREVNETRQYAVQKFAQDVVEAAENLHRGLDSLPAPADGEPEIIARLREGLEGIERNFLGHPGAQRHQAGGPHRRAVRSQPAPGDGGAGERRAHARARVMHAWTPAWTLHGRLLRPAMVVVAKAPPAEITGAGQAGHHRLMQSCRSRTRKPAPTSCPAGPTPIHPCHSSP